MIVIQKKYHLWIVLEVVLIGSKMLTLQMGEIDFVEQSALIWHSE